MSEEGRTIIQLKKILYSLSGLLLAIVLGVIVYRKTSARRLKMTELDVKVRELELTAIRAQMNPHFLFNALNSIQNLVQKKRLEEAHLFLSKFAKLIRKVLNNSSKEEITLHEELEMVQQYVHLEQLRFDFEYYIEISEEVDTYNLNIPPLLLQPVVENAIIHGLLTKEKERKLTIKIKMTQSKVCIFIQDNGIGRKAERKNPVHSNGKGLASVEERLRLISERLAEEYTFEISDLYKDGIASGTLVKICLPVE